MLQLIVLSTSSQFICEFAVNDTWNEILAIFLLKLSFFLFLENGL